MSLGKYTSEGQKLWDFDLPFAGLQQIMSVAASADGVYVAGRFRGEMNFDPLLGDSGRFTSVDDSLDGYLAKYSSDGQFQWALQWGGKYDDGMSEVDVLNGNAYVTGSLATNKFNSDRFLAKVNGDGIVQWSETFATCGSIWRQSGIRNPEWRICSSLVTKTTAAT